MVNLQLQIFALFYQPDLLNTHLYKYVHTWKYVSAYIFLNNPHSHFPCSFLHIYMYVYVRMFIRIQATGNLYLENRCCE